MMMSGSAGEMMSQLGSTIFALMAAYTMFQNYFPYELIKPLNRYFRKLLAIFNPYVHITFTEFCDDGFERSVAYSAIQRYLNSTSTKQAKYLKANVVRDTDAIVLTMADYEEITANYKGIRLWWASYRILPDQQTISFYPREDEKREFWLTFHRRHRELITGEYLKHVVDEGKAIIIKERRRKLYTNNKSESWNYYSRSMWNHVAFEHPATFDTLAMDDDKKQDIINDLINFTKSKDYYAKIGKAWKRGYLLYGPPGTGKSSMIAAMANLLKYDVYDLELTAVMDNTELRKLLIDTASKSILVIEDIDCSLDLTGQREKKKKKKKKDNNEEDNNKKDEDDAVVDKTKKMEDKKKSQVTLSGLLNFIDGLWSACGEERIIVFTTNYVEKLDPALIRRGRMDKHIELSYCSFEAFKILARNYLGIESHELFDTVRQLLEETKMTPADVAENLMPKSGGEDAGSCLKRLLKALEESRVKAEDEEKHESVDESWTEEEAEKETENGEVIKDVAENGVKENGVD